MRTPRNTNKIVKNILDEFGLRKAKRAEIEAEIRASFVVLQTMKNAPAFGYPADNKGHATKLKKWAEQGEALFTDMPKSFLRAIFYGTDMFKAASDLQRFVLAVGWFGRRSAVFLETKSEGNRNTDLQKRGAVMTARYFTERCGLPLSYSNPKKAYRVTAPLFHQAMTGECDLSLKDQCALVARLPDPTWNEWQQKFGAAIARVLRRPQLPMDDKNAPREARYFDSGR